MPRLPVGPPRPTRHPVPRSPAAAGKTALPPIIIAGHRPRPTARPARPPGARAAAPPPPPGLANPAPAPAPPPPALADPQAATPLLDAVLARGAATSQAAFHIPGHKKGGQAEAGGAAAGAAPPPPHLARLASLAGAAALAHDLTELAGLDLLSAPAGPIAAAQALAADAVGAAASRFLVNGSTGGLAAAVVAACAVWRGDQRRREEEAGGSGGAAASRSSSSPPPPLILAARNCHQSVFAAAAVAGADLAWVAPGPAGRGWAGVAPPLAAPALAAALARLDAAGRSRPAAVVVVSPTYFGQVADVQGESGGRKRERGRSGGADPLFLSPSPL